MRKPSISGLLITAGLFLLYVALLIQSPRTPSHAAQATEGVSIMVVTDIVYVRTPKESPFAFVDRVTAEMEKALTVEGIANVMIYYEGEENEGITQARVIARKTVKR